MSHRLNAFIKTQKRTASVAVAAKNATHLADDLLPRATKRARVAESASTSAREWGLYTYSPLSLPPSCTHSSLQVCISVCICEMEAYVSGMWAWQQHCVCCLSFAVCCLASCCSPHSNCASPLCPSPPSAFPFHFSLCSPPSPVSLLAHADNIKCYATHPAKAGNAFVSPPRRALPRLPTVDTVIRSAGHSNRRLQLSQLSRLRKPADVNGPLSECIG